MKPMIQAAMKIKVHLRGVMMVRQWRGLHMAAYLSKDMAISRTISAPPTTWLKKICVIQPPKEMTFFFLKRSQIILGAAMEQNTRSMTERLARRKYMGERK
jgi:hypothetical protein